MSTALAPPSYPHSDWTFVVSVPYLTSTSTVWTEYPSNYAACHKLCTKHEIAEDFLEAIEALEGDESKVRVENIDENGAVVFVYIITTAEHTE